MADKKFFFTFGSNHLSDSGESLGFAYVMIEAQTEGFARHIMSERRGLKWAFSYTEEEFKTQPAEYGLYQLTLDQVTLPPWKREVA